MKARIPYTARYMRIHSRFILFLIGALFVMSSEGVAQLKASFYANVTTGCAPLVVQFTSNSTGSPTSYQWNLGNGTTVASGNSAPSTTYLNPGVYTVSLTISNGSGTHNETKTGYIVVRDNPIVGFTGSPLAGCPGTTVNFSNSTNPNGTSATYTWYFGDGGTSNSPNPSYTYNNSGKYKVQLYATNNYGCKKLFERVQYVEIYDRPSINFTVNPADICVAGTSVSFSGTANGKSPLTYSWQFGDGGTGGGQNTSHVYNGPAPKTYNVELQVTDGNGCTNKITKQDAVRLHHNKASFTAPIEVCPGTPVTFTNTSTTLPASCTWTFGDGGGSNAISPTHIYSTPGTYTVKLETNVSGCNDAFTKTIKVLQPPDASFTTDPDSACPAPVTVLFKPNNNYPNYLWEFGDGTPGNSQTMPSHLYNANGQYVARLIVTDAKGCKDTVSKLVKIYDLGDTITATPREGCVPLEVNFKAHAVVPPAVVPPFTPYPFGVKIYHWDFGDGSSFSGPNSTVSHIYVNPGEYKVISTITTNNGCTAKDTFIVRAGTPPLASFVIPTRVCHREAIQFVNTTPEPVNGHWWDFGDGTIDTTSANPTHQYFPGTYTVKYIAYYNGCPSNLVTRSIIIDSPDAKFAYKTSCHKDSLKYIWFRNENTGATTWTWHYGDGQTSTAFEEVHLYPAYGTYSVMMVAHNANSNCYDTMIHDVKIINPTAFLVASDTVTCKGRPVKFTASVIGSGVDSFKWQSTNGASTPLYPRDTCSYVFTDSGVHKVTATLYDEHGCPQVASKDILVSQPVARFGAAPRDGCVPVNVLFTDSSIAFRSNLPIVQRKWDFGDGTVYSTVNNTISYTYGNAGAYTVKLVIKDFLGCMDSLSKPGYIKAYKPKASFGVDDKNCVGAPLGISNTSQNASTYWWDFGNGNTSTAAQPAPIYHTAGVYTITLVAKDGNDCFDTFSKTISIQKPTSMFSMTDSLSVCPPLSVKFNVTATGIKNWMWTFNDSNATSLKSPNKLFTYSAKHKITLVVTDTLGCKDSLTKYVDILGYTGGFSYTPLKGCVPLEVEFTSVLNNIPFVIWDFNDGYTEAATSGTTKHTYTFPGTFTPKLIFTDGKGCTSSNPGTDPIEVDDAVAHFTSTPLCEYSDVEFTDSSYGYFSNIVSRAWRFNDSIASIAPVVTVPYKEPGQYKVRLIVRNQNGCMDTLEKYITINPSPEIDAGADTVICVKDSATLYPSGGISYRWSPASYLDCDTCMNPKAAPPKRFVYTVEGTDIHGCKNTDTVEVDTKSKVVAIAGEGGEICDLQSFELKASGAQTYEWFPAYSLDNNKVPNPKASPHETTNYMVVSYEGSCIPDTDLVKVTVYPLPTVEARGATTIIAGSATDLQAQGTHINRFAWSPPEDLSCVDCSAPIARPTKTTTYTVTVYTDRNCVDSDKVTITVLCDESQVFMPNTFTPNGDGQNDIFYPRGAGLSNIESLRVYTRWGELVFERTGFAMNDESAGWDGNFKGRELPPDVYVYTLFVKCDDGEMMKLKGDISIVR